MTQRTVFSEDEVLADADFAQRTTRGGRLFHGGTDSSGAYVPPRSRHRLAAIDAWQSQLADAGHARSVLSLDDLPEGFFPNVDQAKLLLRNGARGAMTRILTLIGVVEGFGNDGIKLLPAMDLQACVASDLTETCLGHLHKGLLTAHGRDEAGHETECGHDEMWFAVRDAALDDPKITLDMFEDLPIAPPPGYTGPAKPSADAMSIGQVLEPLVPGLDPLFEVHIRAMTQILLIELVAYRTFAWASEVLGDATCSVDPTFAAGLVDRIRTDEDIHVAYLQTALAEITSMTLLTTDGRRVPGADAVRAACASGLANQTGARAQRLLMHRLRQVEADLANHPEGDRLLEEFRALGPLPSVA